MARGNGRRKKRRRSVDLQRSKNWVSGLRPVIEKGSNPKDEHGTAKVPLLLVSPSANALEAICMDDGNIKYGPYNYRVSKVQAYVYLEAAKRHIDAVIDGQDFDVKTGKPHLGYARATLGIYLDAWINGNLLDNRPLPGKTGNLLDAFARSPGDPPWTAEETQKMIEKIIRG